MNYYLRLSAISLLALCGLGLIVNFKADNEDHSNVLQEKLQSADTTNKLLKIANLEDFYYSGNDYDLNFLTAHKVNQQKKVGSVSVSRFSTSYQKFLREDSILLNKSGIPVMKMRPDESDSFSYTYFFYDGRGNRYLEVQIGSNKYDTTYTLRKFDLFNHKCKEIVYNLTRKEYGRFTTLDITPVTDSVIRLKLVIFDSDIKYENVLPFECREILAELMQDSTLQTATDRIIYADTSYNSAYRDSYRIENNTIIPLKKQSVFSYNTEDDWIEKKSDESYIKREFYFYEPNDIEARNDFSINQSILKFLYMQIDSLPVSAWKKYNENQNSFAARMKIIEEGSYGEQIELKEGITIEEFTPQLWNLVSTDSGKIEGHKNMCVVAGYNTPIKSEDGYNMRCLAIYEHCNGKYMLRKQSFGAIEDFIDSDDDLLFDGYDETNFSVGIEDGNIVVSYEYMRGEASYTFTYKKGNWILAGYASGHRTCCEAESYSYDYNTKEYSFSVFSTSDDTSDETSRDTTITEIRERPIVYMDSLNSRAFDM